MNFPAFNASKQDGKNYINILSEELNMQKDMLSKRLILALKMDHEEKKVKAEFNIKIFLEHCRIKTKNFLLNSIYGFIYENFILFISFYSCFQFILRTYLTNDVIQNATLLETFHTLESTLSFIFLFNWCLCFFIASRKISYITSFISLVDISTLLSIWVTLHQTCPVVEKIHTFHQAMLYFAFGLTNTRILRALRIKQLFSVIQDSVDRCLAEMSTNISIMILFNAATMQFLESTRQPYLFHTWMYYILVTISTVGYGDITPVTTLGRIAAMAMICVAIISVPRMTNELILKMKMHSIYARSSYQPKSKNSKHVLICGDLRSTSLREFFGELFHEDHHISVNAVVLQPEAPSLQMLEVLRLFEMNLCYLEGSPLKDRDLTRAHASTAISVFLLTNKLSLHADEDDSVIILQHLSIKRFTDNCRKVNKNQTQTFCMQLIRRENQRHLKNNNVCLVIGMNEIKMGVFAKAVIFPGVNTLLLNLITSFTEPKSLRLDDLTCNGSRGTHWLCEYTKGCEWEIYSTKISPIFRGSKFAELAFIVYQKKGVILFGLQLTDIKLGITKVLLNPAEYVIPKGEDFRVVGFVIAKNQFDSDLFFETEYGEVSHLKERFRKFSTLLKIGEEEEMAKQKNSKKDIMTGTTSIFFPSKQVSPSPSSNVKEFFSSVRMYRKKILVIEKYNNKDSTQERLHKLKQKYLFDNYHTRRTIPSIEECTINTSLAEELPNCENHIVIMGRVLENLYDLIRPLRAKYLGAYKYIVILHPFVLSDSIWQRIGIFKGILLIRGSPLVEKDIRRAGILRASQVVILANVGGSRSQTLSSTLASTRTLESLADSDSIFCYNCVRRIKPQLKIVVEMLFLSSIIFLEPNSNYASNLHSNIEEYKVLPQFASGSHVFSSSLLDALLCQTFFNPSIVKVVIKLINGADHIETKDLLFQQQLQTDELNCNDKEIIQLNNQAHSVLNTIRSSSLYLIAVPPAQVKKTYDKLFAYFATLGIICIGLLRAPNDDASNATEKMQPYVYTNPDKKCIVRPNDKVFLLSTEPFDLKNSTIKDLLQDLHTRRSLKKSTKQKETMYNIKESFINLQKAHTRLKKKFEVSKKYLNNKIHNKFSGHEAEINSKINSVLAAIETKLDRKLPFNEFKSNDEILIPNSLAEVPEEDEEESQFNHGLELLSSSDSEADDHDSIEEQVDYLVQMGGNKSDNDSELSAQSENSVEEDDDDVLQLPDGKGDEDEAENVDTFDKSIRLQKQCRVVTFMPFENKTALIDSQEAKSEDYSHDLRPALKH